jgi:frataxin-like iron-binding protein CyaY
MLSEQEFRVKSDEALGNARHQLLPLADEAGFEVELQNGVLDLVFEEPRESKFVVSPNAPVRQIWVSAMSRSYKLAWAKFTTNFCLAVRGFVPSRRSFRRCEPSQGETVFERILSVDHERVLTCDPR